MSKRYLLTWLTIRKDKIMLSCLWELRFIIVVVVAFILLLLLEVSRGKAVLYALMLQGKRYAKDTVMNSGAEQEEWVVKKALQFMPKSLTLFLCESSVRWIVRKLFLKLKDYMDDGVLNNSV
jgi:hypothetical protein